MPEDIRWKQRFDNYVKALQTLSGAVELAKKRSLSMLEEQGVIQSFEFTHDLLGFTSALFNKKSFYIGRGSRGKLGSQFLGLDFDEFIDSNQVLDRDGKYFIFSAFSQAICDFLILKKCISPENIFLFNDTILAYYIYNDILKNDCKIINSICRTEMNRDIFRKFISSQINNFSYKLSCSNFLAHLITHEPSAVRASADPETSRHRGTYAACKRNTRRRLGELARGGRAPTPCRTSPPDI